MAGIPILIVAGSAVLSAVGQAASSLFVNNASCDPQEAPKRCVCLGEQRDDIVTRVISWGVREKDADVKVGMALFMTGASFLSGIFLIDCAKHQFHQGKYQQSFKYVTLAAASFGLSALSIISIDHFASNWLLQNAPLQKCT